jgi:citrate lyase beta subunit
MGLGSHDYCSDIGMVHSRKNLYYPQMLLHTICKAKHLLSIDIASMELDDMDAFKDEVKEAYDLGFDAKFIIHPKQLDVINELSYFTEKEMETIKNIYNQIKNRNIENIAPIRIGGHLYEKPHFKRILQIMEPREDGKK